MFIVQKIGDWGKTIKITVNTYFKFLFIYLLIEKIYLFLETGEGREKERNISVWLPLECSLLGTWPTTQAWALTGN